MGKKSLSHTDSEGKAHMVDVGGKPAQERIARAEGYIKLQPGTLQLIRDNEMKKGEVLVTAEIAGIQAAKQTSSLIPLCHILNLTKVDVKAVLMEEGIRVESLVKCLGQTGVEMEALTAVSVSLLTIYDMCKAVDQQMEIGRIRLIEKIKRNRDA